MSSLPTMLSRNNPADKPFIDYAIRNRHNLTHYMHAKGRVYTKLIKGTGTGTGTGTGIEIIGPGTITGTITDGKGHHWKNSIMKAAINMRQNYSDNMDLIRDYYLIRDANSMYFSGKFENLNNSSSPRLQIKDGWIVEMFVNKLIENENMKYGYFPVYMLSDDMGCWCQLQIEKSEKGPGKVNWKYIGRAPNPQGIYVAFCSF
jgi:hypothetical protein